MHKASMRARRKQRTYLISLSQNNPGRFEKEWEKRLEDWRRLIDERGKRMKDFTGDQYTPLFSVVDHALCLLKECGKKTFNKYSRQMENILYAECARAISIYSAPPFCDRPCSRKMVQAMACGGTCLRSLAETDPMGFEREWEDRLKCWLKLINERGATLTCENGPWRALFDVVQHAHDLLVTCGTTLFKKYAERTHDLLTAECVLYWRAFQSRPPYCAT